MDSIEHESMLGAPTIQQKGAAVAVELDNSGQAQKSRCPGGAPCGGRRGPPRTARDQESSGACAISLCCRSLRRHLLMPPETRLSAAVLARRSTHALRRPRTTCCSASVSMDSGLKDD